MARTVRTQKRCDDIYDVYLNSNKTHIGVVEKTGFDTFEACVGDGLLYKSVGSASTLYQAALLCIKPVKPEIKTAIIDGDIVIV